MPKPKSSNNRAHEQSKGQRTKTAIKSIQKQEENRKTDSEASERKGRIRRTGGRKATAEAHCRRRLIETVGQQ